MARSDTAILVIHEIYGINRHIRQVCDDYRLQGYHVICPNLTGLEQSFDYVQEKEAHQFFMQEIGFSKAAEKVGQIIRETGTRFEKVFLVGFSIGATIAWICSGMDIDCDGIICYYGSRIRDHSEIEPKCPALLFFPSWESSFDVEKLVQLLEKKKNTEVYSLEGSHGFADPFSGHFNECAFQTAKKLSAEYLKSM